MYTFKDQYKYYITMDNLESFADTLNKVLNLAETAVQTLDNNSNLSPEQKDLAMQNLYKTLGEYVEAHQHFVSQQF